jgi:hypothetical protein
MAYDSARQVVVLFGGRSGGAARGDTWEWNGSTWTLAHPGDAAGLTAPHPRDAFAMTYDSVRHVTVLFGGFSDTYLGDTWEWDGQAWSHRHAGDPAGQTAPHPRSGHAMAFHTDAQNDVTLLYGGESSNHTFYTDTWEWNGSTWTRRVTSGPGPHVGNRMACDPVRGRTLLFGIASVNDTWEWSGSFWSRQHPGGSSAPIRGKPAFDSVRGRIVLFTSGTVNETWEWEGSGQVWTRLSAGGDVCSSAPVPRDSFALAFDSDRSELVLFGGLGGGLERPGTWTRSADTWTPRTDDFGSVDCASFGIAFDAARGDANYYAAGILWTWNSDHWTPRHCGGPPFLTGTMAFDNARGRTVLFNQQTWEWDGTDWQQLTAAGPPSIGPMAYDRAHGVTVLFVDRETWSWDGAEWVLLDTTGPPLTTGHALAFHGDETNGEVTMFGGYDGTQLRGETWTWNWDTSRWTTRSITGPAPRRGHLMAYDAVRRVTVLFGGDCAGECQENGRLWEWNGAEWNLVTLPGPTWCGASAMTYDSLRRGIILVGGPAGTTPNQTWELVCRCPGDLNNDGAVSLSDVAVLLSHFGRPCDPAPCASADGDLDRDGDVDLSDLTLLLSVFGTVCP